MDTHIATHAHGIATVCTYEVNVHNYRVYDWSAT